jgi:hypothetical protein
MDVRLGARPASRCTAARRRRLSLGIFVAVVAALMALAPSALAKAISTTDDPGFVENGLATGYTGQPCAQDSKGTGAVNCNQYGDKRDVFESGLSTSAALGAGTYFFAVLDPSGQADPNDGSAANLSSNNDSWTNREFTVDGNGNVTSYTGTHAFDQPNNEIGLFPFDDTSNPGGVYIAAVCAVPSSPTTGVGAPGVHPKDCKYDAFKIVSAGTCTQNCGGGGGSLSDLSVFKTATPTFQRTYGWDAAKSADSSVVKTSTGSATASYTVTATWSGPTDSGWDVSGQITVTNPNSVDVPVTLSDQIFDVSGQNPVLDSNATCAIADSMGTPVTGSYTIPADTAPIFNYDCTYSGAPFSSFEENMVTVNWDGVTLGTPHSEADWEVPFTWDDGSSMNPAIQDNCATVTDTFNNGTPDTLGTVCADGTHSGDGTILDGNPPTYDSKSQTWTFHYSRTLDTTPGACATYDNTADFTTSTLNLSDSTTNDNSASVEACEGADLTLAKNASTSYTRTYNWTISKSANKSGKIVQSGSTLGVNYSVTASETGFTDSAIQATGTITVSNPNNWEAVQLSNVADAQTSNGGTCSYTNGTSANATASIPASGSVTLDYTCTWPDGTLPSNGTNTATATWDATAASTPDGSADSNAAAVNFGGPSKTVNQTVTPTDTFNGGTGVDLCTLDTSGAPGSCTLTASDDTSNLTTETYNYTRTLTGTPGTCKTFPNTAGFVEISPTSGWSVTLCVATDLTVGKTANTSYTRTYSWTITKTVNHNRYTAVGGTVTPTYTVVVTQGSSTDSNIKATGVITVSNPNDFEAVKLTGVSDAIGTGWTCSIDTGSVANETATIAASGQVTLNYTCTYSGSSLSAAAGTNTATATWSATTANTPDGSKSGTAPVTFGGPSATVNKTITPTDKFNGGTGVNLCTLDTTDNPDPCTLTATDPPAAATTQTYTYTRTIPVTANACKAYTNTAGTGLTGTGQTSSQTVTVCGAGGLTMGFWQNNNGQGIITKGAYTGTAKVCNVGTWLRTFNPFQDLSATATCAQVATYVTTVIKAATCSTTANGPCNAMLKAQMLATALDVYFSDPALGGNQIGGFTGLGSNQMAIGGLNVDLTKICAMTDGTSSSTCSGTFGTAVSAFNPPAPATQVSCQSVTTLLGFSNQTLPGPTKYPWGNLFVSNGGGVTWYSSVKSYQVLAKNTFDSINNNNAFGC